MYRFADTADVNGNCALSRETNPPVDGVYQRACAETFAVAGSVQEPWKPTRTCALPAVVGTPNGSNAF